ncbi:unnamed protein product [Orchesella dallaii]|uniref:CIDE-N domain-containing protein n=1 Tax=Orchesella dallaii TaxID=48710 RepID=A0ABP1QAY4_9HEXA
MSRETSRARRPFKVWDSSRATRKALVVSSLEELIVRGREKLGVGVTENVRAVLETDGTQVDDSEYFRSLPDNTVFLLLRPGERWCPAGVDVIRADFSGSSGRLGVISGLGPGGASRMGVRTLVSKDGKLETVINDYGPKTPTITVISHEDHPPYDSVPRPSRSSVPPPLPPHGHLIGHHIPASYQYGGRGLPRQGSSSLESSGGATAPIHVHTAECSQRGQFPPQHPPHGTGGRGSPPEPLYCDFHCCALHEEGRKIQVHKAVATSPIQEPGLEGAARMTAGAKSLHVRFMGVGEDKDGRFIGGPGVRKIVPSSYLSVPYSGVPPGVGVSGSIIHPHDLGPGGGGGTTTESSESETENNHSVMEEDTTTTQKFLLLIDQLSLDQKRHLTIKDIGVILERLSSKIVDVERLDRESEAEDCFNWTIKATIRGDFLRELGVIYNGNFYAISEHPAYYPEHGSSDSHQQEQQQDQPPPLPSHQTSSTGSQTGSRNSAGNGASGGGNNTGHHQPSASHASRIDDEDMKL